MFLKGFNVEERQKLGKIVGVCLSNGLGNPSCLCALFDDHLVKEGKIATTLIPDKWFKVSEMVAVMAVVYLVLHFFNYTAP